MTVAPRRDLPDQVSEPTDPSVPDCRTGPAGRLRFVVGELAALWRDRRHRVVDPASLPTRRAGST